MHQSRQQEPEGRLVEFPLLVEQPPQPVLQESVKHPWDHNLLSVAELLPPVLQEYRLLLHTRAHRQRRPAPPVRQECDVPRPAAIPSLMGGLPRSVQ